MIKERIKEILKEKGLTQKDLAEKLNVKQETISRQISGNPTLNTLSDIAKALNIEVHNLFSSSVNKSISKKIEYEVETYDAYQQSAQQRYLNDKARYGWELISTTQFTDKDSTPCFRFYFKREIES